MDLSDHRVSYEGAGLDVSDLDDDPFEQFRAWFDEAVAAGEGEPYAMVLSTVDENGRPRGRNVLLRAVDHGWVFYTLVEGQGAGVERIRWPDLQLAVDASTGTHRRDGRTGKRGGV